MSKSNKPIIWGLFAVGGTVAAFLTPVLVLLLLCVTLNLHPRCFTYEFLHNVVISHWLGKFGVFSLISLSLWHAAHRMRITMHDLGIRMDLIVAIILYIIAAIGTILTAYYLSN